MKQVWIERPGGPETLTVHAVPIPNPAPQEVRLRVSAAGISHADLLVRRGRRHPGSPAIPLSPGFEVAGTVDAVGEGVNDLAPGRSVVAIVSHAGYSDFVCTEAWRCLPLPDGLSEERAALLGVAYWTAYYLLHHAARLQAGQSVLIHGASGAVGTALAELDHLAGLQLYGTASAAKHNRLRGYGVTLIDYRHEDFVARLDTLAPQGMQAVFDPIGGANWPRSYRTLRRGGRLLVYGARALEDGSLLRLLPYALLTVALALWPDGRSVRFVGLLPERQRQSYRRDLAKLLALLADGLIEPSLAATFHLTEAAEAHRLLEQERPRGKLLLLPKQ